MKNLTLLALLFAVALAPAQDMVIHKLDGSLLTIKLLDIESITFTEVVTPPDTAHPIGMVWIPAGSFEMGSDYSIDEASPIHTVTLTGFWMDVKEVTNAQFKAYCDATHGWHPVDPIPGYFTDYPDYPVVMVTWAQASAYAAWAGKSLPTEAEWEYAARGGLQGKSYPWGDGSPSNQCNWFSYSGALSSKMAPLESNWVTRGTLPVGSFAANGYGLYDMAGNVHEWCMDWFAVYSADPQQNPQGPASGDYRIMRGSSWPAKSGDDLRVSYRSYWLPNEKRNFIGFRCVKRP